MSVHAATYRFTVDKYERLIEAGILSEDDRVELIEGEIVEMVPIGTRHADCVNRLTRLLVQAVGDGAVVSIQNPVRLGEFSEPQPDLAVLRPQSYAARHPGPTDVLLIVEVADSSAGYDRRVRLPLYARHGILEVWLVALRRGVIEVHRDPSADGYRSVHRMTGRQHLGAQALPDIEIVVEAILPGER